MADPARELGTALDTAHRAAVALRDALEGGPPVGGFGAARRALRALLAAYRRALALAGRGLQLEGARQPQRQEPARASSPMLDALSANLLAEAAVVQAQAEAEALRRRVSEVEGAALLEAQAAAAGREQLEQEVAARRRDAEEADAARVRADERALEAEAAAKEARDVASALRVRLARQQDALEGGKNRAERAETLCETAAERLEEAERVNDQLQLRVDMAERRASVLQATQSAAEVVAAPPAVYVEAAEADDVSVDSSILSDAGSGSETEWEAPGDLPEADRGASFTEWKAQAAAEAAPAPAAALPESPPLLPSEAIAPADDDWLCDSSANHGEPDGEFDKIFAAAVRQHRTSCTALGLAG